MPQAPRVPIYQFNTLDFEPKYRFDVWQDNMGILFDLLPPDGGRQTSNFRSRIEACNLGEMVFGVTQAQSQWFKRSASRVAYDDMDHILVQVFLDGGGILNRTDRVLSGDMLIIDLAQPHDMVNTSFENLTLVLPRDVNPKLSMLLASLHGRHLSSGNPLVKLIGKHLVSLWDVVPEMNLRQAAGAVQGSLGLMLGWLSNDRELMEDGEPEVSMALGRAIRDHIESRLGENLSAEQLAAIFKVSRSQIYRMFRQDGGVARYTWERRLQRALRMLSQPGAYGRLSIGAIGYECGFSNDSHFSKAFKAQFGKAPRTVRAEAEAAWLNQMASSESRERHIAYLAAWIRNL